MTEVSGPGVHAPQQIAERVDRIGVAKARSLPLSELFCRGALCSVLVAMVHYMSGIRPGRIGK